MFSEIPSNEELKGEAAAMLFVDRLIAAGADICAVGDRHFVMGDRRETKSAIAAVIADFGPHDHLRQFIVDRLRQVERFIDVNDSRVHWSQPRGAS